MIPPRRTTDVDLVDVLLGVEAMRVRGTRVLEALLADRAEPDGAPVADGDLVDFLLGLVALARAVELEPPVLVSPPSESEVPAVVERLLR